MRMTRGNYSLRIADGAADLRAAQELRHCVFFGRPGRDADAHDADAQHVLIEDRRTKTLAGCYRFHIHDTAETLNTSYSALSYDLSPLARTSGALLEMGRFGVHHAYRDADILRLAWAALTRVVDDRSIAMLFGCASFLGTDPGRYEAAFTLLRDRHLGPADLRPRRRADRIWAFAAEELPPADTKRALQQLPPLLRTYISMGGWVSDHAVVDAAMSTLHVFTCVEIAAIPAARKRLLRSLVASSA